MNVQKNKSNALILFSPFSRWKRETKPGPALISWTEAHKKKKESSILKESNLFCLDTAPLQEKWIIWEMYGPKVS